MSGQVDYLFWRLAQYFISEKGYRLIQISEHHNELWLENTRNKQAGLIKLLRHDIDWGNRLYRNIQHTAIQAEGVRKQLMKRELSVLNIYVSHFPPVDEYESYLERPIQINKKTTVQSVMIDSTSMDSGFIRIEKIMGDPLSFSIRDDYEEEEVSKIKEDLLTNVVTQAKEERQLFQYGKPLFSYVILVIQIAVFVLLELSGGSKNTENLIRFGAKFNPLILQGEWWRFFTPIFLHIGVLHLLMNSLALYYLGPTIEKIFGRIRFLWIYLFAGFAGSLASFIFSSSLSAGASGAIFGCFGALLYLGVSYPKLFFRTMGTNVIVVILINLIFGFSVSGIDNFGHIGGLIGGFLAAAIVHFPKKHRLLTQSGALILTTIITIGLLVMGFQGGNAAMAPDVVNSLAQNKLNDQKYQEAYDLLSNYVEKGKGDAITYFQLSYTEIKLQKLPDAKKHLLTSIKKDPKFHEAYFNLALISYDEGNITKAKEYTRKAIELSKDKKYQDFLDQINNMD